MRERVADRVSAIGQLKLGGVWGLVAGLVVVGIGLLVWASAVKLPRPLTELVPATGAAFLIGGILAASVDRWLKTRLLRDAFKSLFGYVLPEQLRGELDWVYTRELLCDRSDLILTIASVESDLLTVRIEWHRDLRNITSRVVSYHPAFTVDEWFHGGYPSSVKALIATQDGKVFREHDESVEGATEDPVEEPFEVGLKLKRMSLKPGTAVTVVAEAEETRRASDAWFLNLGVATAKPRVTVHAPDTIEWRAMFGNREAVREIGPVTRECPGTLLPGQVIQVRWWPRGAVRSAAQSKPAAEQRAEKGGATHNGEVDRGKATTAREHRSAR